MQKVIINPGSGGSDSGNVSSNLIEKDFNLEIAKAIYDNLKDLGIDAYLLRDSDETLSNSERLRKVESLINEGDTVILLTNVLSGGNDSGAEIIYALKDEDKLASMISNNIESIGQNVIKYYQLRDPLNTSQDFYEIIKDAGNTESLIVSFGYVDNAFDNNFVLDNTIELASAVSNAIYDYLKGENIYIVKAGDNLYQIANKFNTTVLKIKELNNLGNNALTIGQELIIPKEETTELPSSNENFIIYTVKSGDSLYSIARNYGTTINVLKDVNNLTSDTLSNGQVLKIPGKSDENIKNYINYTVKPGDSLYKIAGLYETSVNEIKNINGLLNNNLEINQVLKIPTTSSNQVNYINYKVKSGDSLYKIANLYDVTVNEIKNLNNLTSNNLAIDQVLKIPI